MALGGIARRIVKTGIERLPFPVLYEAFYQSARALGIRSYEVDGNAGPLIGSLYDQTAIKSYLRHRTWSPKLLGIFQSFFAGKNGGTFIDIGANIGLVTIPIATNQAVRCISFEPDPQNFRLLNINVHANCPHGNVEIIQAAVFRAPAMLKFARSAYNSGDHHLASDGALTVRAVRLDDIARPEGPLAIKIDTQGAEPAIFEGGLKTFAEADLVVTEFWPWGMRRMGLTPEPLIAMIAETFPMGEVLSHDAAPRGMQPIAEVVKELHALILDGGEFAQADVVLSR